MGCRRGPNTDHSRDWTDKVDHFLGQIDNDHHNWKPLLDGPGTESVTSSANLGSDWKHNREASLPAPLTSALVINLTATVMDPLSAAIIAAVTAGLAKGAGEVAQKVLVDVLAISSVPR